MKLLTRDTDYAVRALVFLARNKKRRISVLELVRQLKTPRPFLRKILQKLNKAGVLKSYKGNRGGFLLAKAPERIFLVDLIGVFQGPVNLNECIFKKKICPNRSFCVLRAKIVNIERRVLEELGGISIASLLKKKE